eukprot:GHUV01015941.1.p1 GENE.GHUV01015941.1~~GHUV01015941.1.p1  ORF type:complete len:107 (+),score=2.22 GHUV01015941.1:885-1205(+)
MALNVFLQHHGSISICGLLFLSHEDTLGVPGTAIIVQLFLMLCSGLLSGLLTACLCFQYQLTLSSQTRLCCAAVMSAASDSTFSLDPGTGPCHSVEGRKELVLVTV